MGGAALGGAPGSNNAGNPAAGQATAGAGGDTTSPECSDPVACIDEVAGLPSSFGNPGWKDSWWVMGCDVKNLFDCLSNTQTCNNNDGPTPEEKGARTTETWHLGGQKGQHYKVTFKFNGVTAAKLYHGGTRDVPTVAGDPHTDMPLDMFYRDGGSLESNYDVLKLTVYDDSLQPVRHYYMNSAPPGNLLDWENHYTFLASYQKSIVVVGQGKIEHLVQDRNCHAINNCGAGLLSDDKCPTPRKLPGGDDGLLLPSKYQDPKDGVVKSTLLLETAYPSATLAQPWHAQASHLTIIAVEKTTDPVDANYP
jgi:hypothetical protein